MDKLILKDESIIELEAGASLGNLTAVYADRTAFLTDWNKLTPENLASVSLQDSDGLIVGNYTDLIFMEPNLSATERQGGTIAAAFHLRKKTDGEKRMDELEREQRVLRESQAVQDGAIADLGAVTSTLAEQAEGGVQ